MRFVLLIMSLFFGLGLGELGQREYSEACVKLAKSYSNPAVHIQTATYITAGTNLSLDVPWELPVCGAATQVIPIDMCRVVLHAKTSNISEIPIEVWLPTKWTGRFMSTGNGDGCIYYQFMAYLLSFGFATVSTLPGFSGVEMTALFHNPEVTADFVYRATHTGVVIGKDVTKAYYGRPHTKSYYFGCSLGGLQGFKEVQDFPGDFDGVVIGDPAIDYNNLQAAVANYYFLTGPPHSDTFLTADQWRAVHADVMNQCDGLDGAKDGIIETPELCVYRPEELLCSRNIRSTCCLTPTQVETVRNIFSPFYGEDGRFIFPGLEPGTELANIDQYFVGAPNIYPTTWYQNVIFEDPAWDPLTLNLSQIAYSQKKNPFNVATYKGDLSAFKSRGGKILSFHGQADSVIASGISNQYYDHVSRNMSLTAKGMDDFYRLFRISGMDHCLGGDGAWFAGQPGAIFQKSPTPQDNMILAIVDWVEKGRGPETLTGYKYVNDTLELGVEVSRRHCRYPARNVCIDPTRYKEPDAWKCIRLG